VLFNCPYGFVILRPISARLFRAENKVAPKAKSKDLRFTLTGNDTSETSHQGNAGPHINVGAHDFRMERRTKMKHHTHLWRPIQATLLATSLMLCLTPKLHAAQREDSGEVTGLLAQAAQEAAQLSRDADDMESLLHSDVSWQTHAAMLDRVRDDVNTMGRTVARLNSTYESGSEWQQQAVDRILPLLRELASNTTAAINHLNANQTRPTTPDYVNYLEKNAETAHQLSEMTSDLVKYAKSRTTLEKMEDKLEFPSRQEP
jgi:hypothetical protein